MIWVLLIAFAFVLLGVILHAVTRYSRPELSQLDAKTFPVDLAALQTLRDPEDTAFLRGRLRPSTFRRVQRMRTRAALEYVSRIANNSRILMRAGEANRTSSDPQVAKTAESVIDGALRLRLSILRVQFQLFLELLNPERSASTASLCDQYESVRWRFGLLLATQAPAEKSRLLAAL
jgi:hypothetical protein